MSGYDRFHIMQTQTDPKPAAADKLLAWREGQGWNQTEAAAYLQMDAAQYARFERGEGRPNAVLCAKIFQRTKVPAHDWGLDASGALLTARRAPKRAGARRRRVA